MAAMRYPKVFIVIVYMDLLCTIGKCDNKLRYEMRSYMFWKRELCHYSAYTCHAYPRHYAFCV
ncbi:unnamed protein product [Albugo candida]|uniref:Secreted protein n=1 Tax=Albugo candida TaxID=65357 RepID=A0A024GJ01_9STRA|nr:unnamed protein product [Albugo candida]|eukprot:CCI46681.1 unnamed protein product [Albugo candida]